MSELTTLKSWRQTYSLNINKEGTLEYRQRKVYTVINIYPNHKTQNQDTSAV